MSCNPTGSRECVPSINPDEECAKEPMPVENLKIPYEELISDYHRIAELEDECFSLCRKYSLEAAWNAHRILEKIMSELVKRDTDETVKQSAGSCRIKSRLYSEDIRLLRGAKEISMQISKTQRKIQKAKDSFATGNCVDEKAFIHLADKIAALKNEMSSIKGRRSLVKKLLKEVAKQ